MFPIALRQQILLTNMMSTRLSFTEHPSPVQIGVFFIILLFGAGLIWSFVTDDSDTTKGTTVPTASSTREDIALDPRLPYRTPLVTNNAPWIFVETDEVLVKDQEADESVFLTKVALMKGGWVAVREGSLEDAGPILGAARFDAGVWQGDVPLLRSLEAGKTYHAVLYYDDGDKKFDFKKDIPIIYGDMSVGMTFQAY